LAPVPIPDDAAQLVSDPALNIDSGGPPVCRESRTVRCGEGRSDGWGISPPSDFLFRL